MRFLLAPFKFIRSRLRWIESRCGNYDLCELNAYEKRPESIETWRHRLEQLVLTLPLFLLLFLVPPSDANAAVNRWQTEQHGALWSDGAHWSSGLPPHAGQTAKIGAAGFFEDSMIAMDEPGFAGQLEISNGMVLRNQHELQKTYLNVSGTTTVNGTEGSRGFLNLHRSNHEHDFRTHNLNIGEHGWVFLDGVMEVNNQLNVYTLGRLNASGRVSFSGDGNTLVNDGSIWTSHTTLLQQKGDGLFDLDGTSESGKLTLGPLSELTIQGNSIADAFDGQLGMSAFSVLRVDLQQGWAVGSNGEIVFRVAESPNTPAIIRGNLIGLDGSLSLSPSQGSRRAWGSIESHTSIGATAEVRLGNRSRLEFEGNADIHGGSFVLEQDADLLRFGGITSIYSGTISTHSQNPSDGYVTFGDTYWNGDLTINGIAAQSGNAVVDSATAIYANTFDMDGKIVGNGEAPHAQWELNHSLQVNADEIDATTGNGFFGTMLVSGNGLGQLQMNMRDPATHWEMGGELELRNQLPQASTRLSGSKMVASGTVKVEGVGVAIAADVDFVDGSTLELVGEETSLELHGKTELASGVQVTGSGDIISRNTLLLANGIDLTKPRLFNHGMLRIAGDESADSIGVARVGQFTNDDQGTLAVEIGFSEDTQTNESDFLVVNGSSTLDGTLALSVLEAEEVLPYDSMVLLETTDELTGQFSQIDGIAFRDSFGIAVTYSSHQVELTPALLGDADLDGEVAFADFLQLSANFGNAGSWTNGDFDGDGEIAFSDFLQLSGNFGESSAVAAVPEPSCISLLVAGLCLSAPQRRRRRNTSLDHGVGQHQ